MNINTNKPILDTMTTLTVSGITSDHLVALFRDTYFGKNYTEQQLTLLFETLIDGEFFIGSVDYTTLEEILAESSVYDTEQALLEEWEVEKIDDVLDCEHILSIIDCPDGSYIVVRG